MLNICTVISFFLFITNISAQQKGASPITTKNTLDQTGYPQTTAQTFAVVVGISDYQDPGIPDLRFADKDAEAFANYLRSSAGGKLDNDHLKLLTNEEATSGNVAATLYWLIEESKEGDNVILYFSGHGDVERKIMGQPGFLLCWDAPPRVYMAGGVVQLGMLQSVISTLSLENKARVIVITDACRSGKLAGSDIGGSKITGASLAQQFANEIKILSCQPEEYSIEGEQWGGGRGAFSYHLLDGLYGLADGNGDQTINLLEIGRYLEDHVPAEVAPQSQIPMTVGSRAEKMATVDPASLARLKEGKKGQMALFTGTESRGIEDEVLAQADSITRKRYLAFKQSLKDKQFMEPSEACADAYFNQLITNVNLERLHAAMRRNYAAALQDDAQQVINKILIADPSEYRISYVVKREKYGKFPLYLDRAAELLGPQHYMYPIMMSRKLFFEGYVMALFNPGKDPAIRREILKKLNKALEWEPGLPHVYHEMIYQYNGSVPNMDSMIWCANKAVELAPKWVTPYAKLGLIFSEDEKEKARYYLEKASEIDPESPILLNIWGRYFHETNEIQKAEDYFFRALEKDSNFIFTVTNLGELYFQNGDKSKAEPWLLKAVQLEPTYVDGLQSLGVYYCENYREEECLKYFLKSIEVDSLKSSTWAFTGRAYRMFHHFDKAEYYLKKALEIDSGYVGVYAWLMENHMAKGEFDKANRIFKSQAYTGQASYYFLMDAGVAYLNYKLYDQAIESMQLLVSGDTTDVERTDWLGYVYLEAGRYGEAEQWLMKAMQLDSNLVYPYENMAQLCIETGREKEAGLWLDKVKMMNPKSDKIPYLKALQYIETGELFLASEQLEQAFDLGYSNFELLLSKPKLAPLRDNTQLWNKLVQDYFPASFKH